MYNPLRDLHQRHLKQLERACYGGEKLVVKVAKGISNEYALRIEKAKEVIAPSGRLTNDYVTLLERYRKVFSRQAIKARRASRAVINTRNELFGGLDDKAFQLRLDAILRIPMSEFVEFDKLSIKQRSQRLMSLVAEYEVGRNRCGFAPNLLNIPGHYNPYLTNDHRDPGSESVSKTGFKRLPPFIYELIDAFIAEAITPCFEKKIFFRSTIDVVKRWGDRYRQIRSEGRLGMVKVFIVLVKRLDYRKSMRIGKRLKDKETGQHFFRGLLREDIADEANMSMDSVKTALRNLENQGILNIAVKQYDEYACPKTHEKKYHALAIVRKMKLAIIMTLGLGDRRRASMSDAKENGLGSVCSTTYVPMPKQTPKQVVESRKSAISTIEELAALGLM